MARIDIRSIRVDLTADTRIFRLRAERAGGGDGRTYTITYEATDACGNAATDLLEVFVPHDRRK